MTSRKNNFYTQRVRNRSCWFVLFSGIFTTVTLSQKRGQRNDTCFVNVYANYLQRQRASNFNMSRISRDLLNSYVYMVAIYYLVILNSFILVGGAPTTGCKSGGECLEKPCNACSGSLMDLLENINQNLIYANRSLNRDRLSETISLKLYDLESSFIDHSMGLRNSMKILNQSESTLNEIVNENSNKFSNVDRLVSFVDQLENHAISVEKSSSALLDSCNHHSNDKDNLNLNSSELDLQLSGTLSRILVDLYQIDELVTNLDTILTSNSNILRTKYYHGYYLMLLNSTREQKFFFDDNLNRQAVKTKLKDLLLD